MSLHGRFGSYLEIGAVAKEFQYTLVKGRFTPSMAQGAYGLRPLDRGQFGKILARGMAVVFILHAILFLVPQVQPLTVSRAMTAALAILAALCAGWRANHLQLRERSVWLWSSAGLFLWGIAHGAETFWIGNLGASNLNVDASDIIYFAAILAFLLAFSTTPETISLRAISLLNCVQIALALALAYLLLYRGSLDARDASTAMGKIYGGACLMLALISLIRSLSWSSPEERQCVRWISISLWIYLPIEIGMDYATGVKGLRAGTPLDLLWSIPVGLAGWKALTLPLGGPPVRPGEQMSRRKLVVEAACPMLLETGIFALAVPVVPRHMILGLAAIFLILIIQGVQAAVIQRNYLSNRDLLLERERDLRSANAALEELTLLDPLTGIANRRRFNTTLSTSWRRAMRQHHPLSMLMVDVDFFKGVNDQHGHSYGDECLVQLARAMNMQARRPDDLVARLGGEEFVVLLPDTDEHGALFVAERLQQAVKDLGIVNDASPFDRRLTVSVGIAIARPVTGMDSATLLEEADRALYDAKAKGRDRICRAWPEPAAKEPAR